MENVTIRTVEVEAQEIHYQLERKPVKNLNLRIRSDRSIYVSANSAVPTDEIDLFVISKASYISNAIERFNEMAKYKPQPKQYVSGETFYIQGRALRLQVSKSEKDMISSDGIYIFLSVKDPDNFDKKRRMVNRFLNKQCRLVFEEIIHSTYPVFEKYGVSYPNLRIRNMETRWGSCLAKKGIITLNKRQIGRAHV